MTPFRACGRRLDAAEPRHGRRQRDAGRCDPHRSHDDYRLVGVVAEEHVLRARYPDYADYAGSTKAIVPFIL
jgi:hypothetical protein